MGAINCGSVVCATCRRDHAHRHTHTSAPRVRIAHVVRLLVLGIVVFLDELQDPAAPHRSTAILASSMARPRASAVRVKDRQNPPGVLQFRPERLLQRAAPVSNRIRGTGDQQQRSFKAHLHALETGQFPPAACVQERARRKRLRREHEVPAIERRIVGELHAARLSARPLRRSPHWRPAGPSSPALPRPDRRRREASGASAAPAGSPARRPPPRAFRVFRCASLLRASRFRRSARDEP